MDETSVSAQSDHGVDREDCLTLQFDHNVGQPGALLKKILLSLSLETAKTRTESKDQC